MKIIRWSFASRDIGVRSYVTTERNQEELCATISVVSGIPFEQIRRYRDEVVNDEILTEQTRQAVLGSAERWSHDSEFRLGRRLAYYLLVRSLRPKLVVEADVDRGAGAIVILRALERNAEEASPGEYVGYEYKSGEKPFLLEAYPPPDWATVLYGDSAELMPQLGRKADLIIHETGTEDRHVRRQAEAIRILMHDRTVVAAPWMLEPFFDLAKSSGRRFLTHQDVPQDHWYGGSRLMFIFR